MFEQKIQFAWDDYSRDFGLGRIILFTCALNTFFFFLCAINYGELNFIPVIPIFVALLFYYFRSHIVSKRPFSIFLLNALIMTIVIVVNYTFCGIVDEMAMGLKRYDSFFANLDMRLYSMPIALLIERTMANRGVFSTLFYDYIQICYMTYFLFPFFGGLAYWFQLDEGRKAKIGRYLSSILIFFNINFLLYIIVPVSGPQFYQEEYFLSKLPFSVIGTFFNNLVRAGQPTFIDCFPSGHTGIALLVIGWMFRVKNHYRYIFLAIGAGMIVATLSLRYHYTLDLVAALPLSILSYKLGRKLLPQPVVVRSKRKWRY